MLTSSRSSLIFGGLGDKSCAALASTLDMNPSIKSVNLCDNPLSNAAVALLVAINQKTPNRVNFDGQD